MTTGIAGRHVSVHRNVTHAGCVLFAQLGSRTLISMAAGHGDVVQAVEVGCVLYHCCVLTSKPVRITFVQAAKLGQWKILAVKIVQFIRADDVLDVIHMIISGSVIVTLPCFHADLKPLHWRLCIHCCFLIGHFHSVAVHCQGLISDVGAVANGQINSLNQLHAGCDAVVAIAEVC